MADAPAPAADAAPAGDIFADYNPQGALGGLFAPAYIHGYAPSEQAVSDWSAAHHISDAQIEASRMPAPFQPQPPPGYGNQMMAMGGSDRYGSGRIPNNLSFGDPRGTVDPQALKIAAQGGVYDAGARRDAIAQRLAENQTASGNYDALKGLYAQQHLARWGSLPDETGIYTGLQWNGAI